MIAAYIRLGVESAGQVNYEITLDSLFMMQSKDAKVDLQSTVEKDVALGEVRDIGANLYAEAERLSIEELERDGREVLRILDWRIMPIVGGTLPSLGQGLTDELPPALRHIHDSVSR